MDLKALLNVILLSLSLATVLITLISYIIYKLKQIAVKNVQNDLYKLEGVFFKRHAPHLERKNLLARMQEKNKQNKKNIHLNLGTLFVIVFGVIGSILLSQSYLLDMQERRKQIASGENLRELVEKGLLRKYEYTPSIDEKKLKTGITESEIKQSNDIKEKIKVKKIVLAKASTLNLKMEDSTERLSNYFKYLGIEHSVKSIENLKEYDLAIFTNVEELTLKEKNIINDNIKSKNKSHLFLENFASKIDKVESTWVEDILGLQFTVCLENKKRPILFLTDKPPWWSIPSTYQTDFFVSDEKICPILKNTNLPISAVDSNYNGDIEYADQSKKLPVVRSVFYENEKNRNAWLGFWIPEVPLEDLQKNEFLLFYENQILLSTFAWLTEIPMFKFSYWPDPTKTPVALSLGPISKPLDLEFYVDNLLENKIPFTLFTNSEQKIEIIELFKSLSPKNKMFEIGIEVLPNKKPKKQDSSILQEDFYQIENARLDLEEFFGRKTSGIKMHESNLDKSIYFSALDNKLSYYFGKQFPFYFNLKKYENKWFVDIPDIKYSEFSGIEKLLVVSENDFINAFKKIKLRSKTINRPIVLKIDDNFLLRAPVFKKLLSELKEKNYNIYTLEELSNWIIVQKNTNLNISIEPEKKEINITFNNLNKKLDQLTLYLDFKNSKLLTSSNEDIKIKRNGTYYEIKFTNLKPKEIVKGSLVYEE